MSEYVVRILRVRKK